MKTISQFYKSIQNDTTLINGVPNVFLEQAEREPNREDNYISGDMFEQRLFSLVISDAKPIDLNGAQAVTIKLGLTAIMDEESGELIPQTDKTANGLPAGQIYVPGFNSLNNVVLGPKHVAAGIITALQLSQIADFGAKWQAGLNSFSNPNHWYEKGPNTKFRLYLTSNGPTSEFGFVPCVRTNPQNNQPAIGMDSPLLQNLKLIGSGITAGLTEIRTRSGYVPSPEAEVVNLSGVPDVTSRAARFKF